MNELKPCIEKRKITNNQSNIFGVMKFFHNEDHLDQLIKGTFYCNTPEFYRLHDAPGVSDPHESCTHAFRPMRGDKPVTITVAGRPLDGLTRATLRGAGLEDRWLHCWTVLRMPQDDTEFRSFICDLDKIRSEFGGNYAFVRPENLRPFFERLEKLTDHPMETQVVKYSDHSLDWSPVCKATQYEYQHELRFLVGECSEDHTDPLVIEDKEGFGQYIEKNPTLQIVSDTDNWIHLEMNGVKDLVVDQPFE